MSLEQLGISQTSKSSPVRKCKARSDKGVRGGKSTVRSSCQNTQPRCRGGDFRGKLVFEIRNLERVERSTRVRNAPLGLVFGFQPNTAATMAAEFFGWMPTARTLRATARRGGMPRNSSARCRARNCTRNKERKRTTNRMFVG